METEEKARRRGRPVGSGRPLKPPGEKYRAIIVRMPPDLLAEFRARVPADRRSAFVRAALRRALGLAEGDE